MTLSQDSLRILYDGDCPFCSNYVQLYRIKQNAGSVELVNVREHPELVDDVRSRGYEINDGMIAIWQGQYYYGHDSVALMSMLGSEKGFFAKLNRLLFRDQGRAARVYPYLVRGRKLALALMGRRLID